jgi:hypothetical protein
LQGRLMPVGLRAPREEMQVGNKKLFAVHGRLKGRRRVNTLYW